MPDHSNYQQLTNIFHTIHYPRYNVIKIKTSMEVGYFEYDSDARQPGESDRQYNDRAKRRKTSRPNPPYRNPSKP